MQSTGHAASSDQKISGVSRLLNAKFLRALWRRGCHFWPCVTCHTLDALHTAGFVVNKRGAPLRFEKWWHIADGAIRCYRKAGLPWWRVAPT